jgi:hypothetical protein
VRPAQWFEFDMPASDNIVCLVPKTFSQVDKEKIEELIKIILDLLKKKLNECSKR